MWIILFFSVLLGYTAQDASPGSYDLTIKVTGIEDAKGQIGFCLISNEAGYPDDCAIGAWKDVTSKDFTTVIKNIPKGKYAIAIYQDLNGDKEMNKNFLGIPKEKYGFSNNPNSKFGLPDFSECLVLIDQNKSIVIEI